MSQTMRKQRIVWVLLGMALGFFGQVGQAMAAADVSAGNLLLDAPTATVGMIKSGGDRLMHRYGMENFFAGKNAGNLTTIGAWNVGVGESALTSITSGNANTATGFRSLYGNTTGYDNTATGSRSLYSNTTGAANTAAGNRSLYSNIGGVYNTATGASSLYLNTKGSYSTATGYLSLYSNTEGFYNTATGVSSLYSNITGAYNTATGMYSLLLNTKGYYNTAMGFRALSGNSEGSYNTAIGHYALRLNAGGGGNVALGYYAGYSNSTGSNNTFLGALAGYTSESGLTNATAIGYNTQVTKNDTVILGYNANVGIGTAAPAYKLDVIGGGHFSGDLVVDGNIAAKYQDVAEWVPAAFAIPSATVVVLDTQRSNTVLPSTKRYDTGVAGVVTTTPGIVLGEAGDQKVKVATFGRVKVKADAQDRAISVGDLLVTSDRAGMAMKSEPLNLGDVSLHRPGTIIGKALEPLSEGQGEILVLLSLQ